ncbi:uncharacterized protein rab44 [Brachionichthys hirsutus]|uniref:uncharacterized protein rab44 n=1 Tax=Brachionichthys hirsutus TaxID=412623 RepID=UPI003604C48B
MEKDKEINEEEKNTTKDPEKSSQSVGYDKVKMDFMQSPEDDPDMENISFHDCNVNAKSDTLDPPEKGSSSDGKDQPAQEIVLRQKKDTLQIMKDVDVVHECNSQQNTEVKIDLHDTENLQGISKQKGTKVGHTQWIRLKKPEKRINNEDEMKKGELNMEADKNIDWMEVKESPKASENEDFKPSLNPLCEGQQETNGRGVIHNKGQRSTLALQTSAALYPGQSASFSDEVVNPVTPVQVADTLHSERNVDVDMEPAQLSDFPDNEMLAERNSGLMNSVKSSNTQNITNNAFTGQSFVATHNAEITNLPQDEALKSAEAPVAVTQWEIAKSEVRGGAGREHKDDKGCIQELNDGNEGVLDKKVEMKNTSSNLHLDNRRRKMGSSRRNIRSQSEGEPFNQKKDGDVETTGVATNAGDVNSKSGSERSKETAFEIVQCSHTVSETTAGGRSKKLGSHRRLPGYGRDAKSIFEESSIKTSEEESMDENKMSEVNDSSEMLSGNISPSNTGENSKPISEKTPVQGIPIHRPPAEMCHGQEGAAHRSNTYNVMLVGDSSVGKTSFMKRVQSGTFSLDVPSTVGLDCCIWTVVIDGKPVILQLWDTAGQERFHSITRQTFHKAQAFLLMYDITSSQSFTAVSYWADCIQEGAAEDVAILLLGNKCDCAERQVDTQEGKVIAKEYSLFFMECSAATGKHVIESLETVARALSQKVDTREEVMALHKEPQQKNTIRCC